MLAPELPVAAAPAAAAASLDADVALVRAHVVAAAPPVMKAPSGLLTSPYLVPGGFYSQLWDHDAVFMGVGLLKSHPLGAVHLAGSVTNFLSRVTRDGEVPGCLLPTGASTTLFHATPVLLWGALLAARQTGDFAAFQPHAGAMRALLAYWRRAPRFDATSGLHVWYDMMESGADDLVYADVPSAHTPGWTVEQHGFRLATPDVQVFMHRELRAFAAFLRRWAADAGEAPPVAELADLAAAAAALRAAVQARLWVATDAATGAGYFAGYDVKARVPLPQRTYQMAWPLWEGMATPTQRAASVAAVTAPDMWTRFGVRTTSADDPRFSNVNIIVRRGRVRGGLG